MVTLVCFAVKEEARPFARIVGERPQLRTLVTGMGWQNAERSLRTALAGERPQRVLTCGFAGGLNPSLPTGTVIFSADADSGLEAALRAAGAKPARFHCLDRVAVTAAEKRALRESTGADAVEMESGIVCKQCQAQHIPSATIRVILDAAGDDLPLDFNTLTNSDREMSYPKLAAALLKSPGVVPRLMAFQKQVTAAAEGLARTLARVLAEG